MYKIAIRENGKRKIISLHETGCYNGNAEILWDENKQGKISEILLNEIIEEQDIEATINEQLKEEHEQNKLELIGAIENDELTDNQKNSLIKSIMIYMVKNNMVN